MRARSPSKKASGRIAAPQRKPGKRRANADERAVARELVWRFREQIPETVRLVDGCEVELYFRADDLCDALERFATFGTFQPLPGDYTPDASKHRASWYRNYFASLKAQGLTPDQAITYLAKRAGVEWDTMRAMVYRRKAK